jgi:hypothetical protein
MARKLACLLAGIVLTLSGIGLADTVIAPHSGATGTVLAKGPDTNGEWPPRH